MPVPLQGLGLCFMAELPHLPPTHRHRCPYFSTILQCVTWSKSEEGALEETGCRQAPATATNRVAEHITETGLTPGMQG